MSHKCNDFIIENGQFKRDFEEMYKNIEDPWNQNSSFNYLDKHFNFFQLMLSNYLPKFGGKLQILDIGCANGYHLNYFSKINGFKKYIGTDISETIIKKAIEQNNMFIDKDMANFLCDDIIKYNKNLSSNFELIFSARTLYYCAPEIDQVIQNISDYLKPSGIFGWIYNQTDDAFSNNWLTYDLLIDKLQHKGFNLIDSSLLDYRQKEKVCIALFSKD